MDLTFGEVIFKVAYFHIFPFVVGVYFLILGVNAINTKKTVILRRDFSYLRGFILQKTNGKEAVIFGFLYGILGCLFVFIALKGLLQF